MYYAEKIHTITISKTLNVQAYKVSYFIWSLINYSKTKMLIIVNSGTKNYFLQTNWKKEKTIRFLDLYTYQGGEV